MITDKNLRVSDATALTSGTAYSDAIDLSVARDIGEGEELYAVVTVGADAFTGGTSVTFDAVVSSAAALSTTPTVVGSLGAVVTASLTAKSQFVFRLNPQLASNGKRYLGLRYTISGTYTAGAVTVDFVKDLQDGKKFYASGFSVQ